MNRQEKAASMWGIASFITGVISLVYGVAATKAEGATDIFSSAPSGKIIILIVVGVVLMIVGSISLFEHLKDKKGDHHA